jgi:hypothetical protein
VRLRRGYLVTTIALWITVAASPAGAQKRYDFGANDTESRLVGRTPTAVPLRRLGPILSYVNDLATFPWHLGVSSAAPKRMTIGRLTLARAAALVAGLPTISYQPGSDHPGNPSSS